MKRFICCPAIALSSALSLTAQNQNFTPGQLAVLRAGDGVISLHQKQAPIFVDQFDPTRFNDGPSLSVAIPTNGPKAFFFNGHAATEGHLTRSTDHRLLAFTGYTGDLLKTPGVPSQLGIARGVGTLGADTGSFTLVLNSKDWYEGGNPRAVVTDGANNFWGAGSLSGTMYFNPQTAAEPVGFKNFLNTRAIKLINQTLYADLNKADGVDSGDAAGVYSYVNGDAAVALPKNADCSMKLEIPSAAPYKKSAGFDISPAGTVAYIADTEAGIQKYVKAGGAWTFAYNFRIPQVIPAEQNNGSGCFGVTVDYRGAAPIIYATTTEGWGTLNSNRVVRIEDTNANAIVTTIAQANSTNIAYRGIEFTPESQPAAAAK